ncbi:zinc transporter ZIP11 isoform X4 [Octopus bimaculoides]|uniref:zinc transporter ZIP11 isoform X4 n=1 Tax=Octopus bimaculoides TaxID=37653 RepID=UPI0022E7A51F|nr:zinc transporter ZIP11 isoform X4 [Octopus bimaculoides]
MIKEYSPLVQALLGTLFTWALTAVGSALVFAFSSGQRKILDGSLGFAAGVMTAASYWSLLDPAVETARVSGVYGKDGQYAFIPVTIGFVLGSLFVCLADVLISNTGNSPTSIALALDNSAKLWKDGEIVEEPEKKIQNKEDLQHMPFQRRRMVTGDQGQLLKANNTQEPLQGTGDGKDTLTESLEAASAAASWKRILLLIVAVTIHNIPEGLAVGVGFGAIGKSKSATFESARNLAIGIGIQNFPEGLAVSLPLRGAGFSMLKAFWYGQLSGMVEPLAGLFGVLAVSIAEPLLPYALAFAAGAMIYVVFDDIIPEAQQCGNGKLSSWCAIFGFCVMMSLDVGLV